jgi:Xaa-Pro aminopeptidase
MSSNNTIPREDFINRRNRFMKKIGDGNIAILVSGEEIIRNGDVYYPFRQNSSFHYLTGFPEPSSVAVFTPGSSKPYTLFVRKHDPVMETWVGPRIGLRKAISRYDANQTFDIDELSSELPKLIKKSDSVWYSVGTNSTIDQLVTNQIAERRDGRQRGGSPLNALRDPQEIIDSLRVIKSNNEVNALQEAINITAAGLANIEQLDKPGRTEYEVQAILESEYRRLGSVRDGFPSIVAAGNNSCTLHYTANRARIKNKDLLLLDTGAEWDLYSADVSRTYPASGKFTSAQKDVYEIVLSAQQTAIESVKPGVTFYEPHKAAVRVLIDGLKNLKVLKGTRKSIENSFAYRPFYMHGTSHWLGLDVHDAGNYSNPDQTPVKLKSGMVLTVEPGLYFPMNIDGVPKELRGIGIRIEDDILVTRNGQRNLSEAIPSKINEIST